MTLLLKLFILIPLTGFVISLLIPRLRETFISWVAFLTPAIHFIAVIGFIAIWLLQGHPTLNLKDIVLLKTSGYEFFIEFYFDKITAVYLFVGSFLTSLVMVYSRYYLHREKGYKRFFNTTLLFYLGYTTAVLSGNLETLFIGWEILGISSFLLIAFYRNRYLPVKNAVKTFSVYRIGDVGLLLALWMSHHLWHESITFLKLNNYELVHAQLQTHSLTGIFISLAILVAAAAKSAQLPFSSWLPRAMEGPTPSSAIFYGSLAVHVGIYVLLRTFPFWEHQLSIRILIGVLGLVTSIIATGIARVQSSIKSQIAYSSISQIGLIFIEIAAGFETLALIHFAGNAFLRTYQLLVSPSVVSYMIREQFYNFKPRQHTVEDSLPKRIEYSIYMLCLKEWNLDSFLYQYLWNPAKVVGRKLDFLNARHVFMLFTPVYLAGLYLLYHQQLLPAWIKQFLPVFFSFIALVMVLKAFTKRKDAGMSWLLVVTNHFWIALAVLYNEHVQYSHTLIYLSGIIVFGIIGYVCLGRLKHLEHAIDLDQFHGYSYKYPKLGLLFLISCLGVAGFPITPTFIGEDLIFNHIRKDQFFLAFFTSLTFIIDGIAIIRIYARIFMGPYAKSIYDMAYRSS